jgi:hypothetical protein
MMSRLLAFGLCALVAATVPAQPPIQWGTFQEGTHSRLRHAETRVLMTEGDWQVFWRRLTGNPPETAPRGIDWNTEFLAAVALGERRTGGFRVFVDSIERGFTGGPVIRYVELTPGPGDFVTQAITSPYVIVRIGRFAGGPAAFARLTKERPGRDRWHDRWQPWFPSFWDPSFPHHAAFPRNVRYRLLDAGCQSGVVTTGTRIMNTPQDFRRYWVAILGDRRAAQTPKPHVDWATEYVAAIHLGVRSGSGHSVFVDSVVMINAGALQIRWFEIRPQVIGLGSSTPYALIAIPRGTGSPTFIRGMTRTN